MDMEKKMTVRRLLSGALVLLGFASCSNDGDEGEIICEYGTPYAKFQVKGKVTDEAGKALKNIQVVVREGWNNVPWDADTVYTDAKGEFQSNELSGVSIDKQQVYFHDVDGDENGGTFKSDSIKLIDLEKKTVEKGSGGWYQGTFEFSTSKPVKLSKEEKKDA